MKSFKENSFKLILIFVFGFFMSTTNAFSKSIITTVNYDKIVANSVDDVYKERTGLYAFTQVNFDLSKLSATKRKDVFVKLLLPSINVVQKEILNNREIVKKLKAKDSLNDEEQAYATKLFSMYRVKNQNWDELQERMIIYPTSLILTQGAIESAWGTSRFFKEANNIFGIWAPKDSSGKKIKAKGSRGTFTPELRAEGSLKESVEDLELLISHNNAYKNLRSMIWEEKSPYDIAGGLLKYSEEGAEYVKKIRNTMEYNKFEQYDKVIPYF